MVRDSPSQHFLNDLLKETFSQNSRNISLCDVLSPKSEQKNDSGCSSGFTVVWATTSKDM